jgi:hypothetical protein
MFKGSRPIRKFRVAYRENQIMLLEEKNGKLIVELCMTLQALILSLRNALVSYFWIWKRHMIM